ncbi:unnamed protein product [Nippostrongylus brasiliensis]|uniref:YkuD domain-containing protein n=1 Tax=Nippostrongylus brasiliensis TaxID=27835 RepID=A0A0N4XY24_NIPBR|nr:unnamed protein product [Nippostrongylus brasiliensis]
MAPAVDHYRSTRADSGQGALPASPVSLDRLVVGFHRQMLVFSMPSVVAVHDDHWYQWTTAKAGENEIEIFSVDEGPRFLQWNLERPRPAPLGTLRRLIPRYHERSRRVRRQFFPPYGGGFYPGWGFRRPAGLVGGQQVMIHTPLGPIGYTKVSGFGFG